MTGQECRLLHDGIVMTSMSMCVPEREKGQRPLSGFIKLNSIRLLGR